MTGGGLVPRVFGFALSVEVVGPSGRIVGCVVGFSGGGVSFSGGVVGLSGDVVGLWGRAVGCVAGLSGSVVGLSGRAVGLSSCSFVFPFFSCSAAGELIGPARKANASAVASQCDFDFK